MTQLSTKYIEMALGRGESETNIKETLRIQGISEVDIDSAFKEIQEKKSSPQSPQSPQPPNQNKFGTGQAVQSTQPITPVPPKEQQPDIPKEIKTEKSRIEYNKRPIKKIIILAIIGVFLGGAVFAGYYCFEDIVDYVGLQKTGIFVEPETPADLTPPSVVVPEPEPETPVLTDDEKKISDIESAKGIVDSYYFENSIYPETIDSIGTDNFYCYRKSGAHYILGTTLEEGNILLSDDLDGNYVCGDIVKNCADPVYCVGPQN